MKNGLKITKEALAQRDKVEKYFCYVSRKQNNRTIKMRS